MTRSLIEQWLPAAKIGAESLRDASAAKKPPNSRLHVWWARRPLTASRAAVLASLLPAWPTEAEAAEDPRAAKVLAGLQAEFPDGEAAYRNWFLRALGILGDPVAARAAIKAAVAAGRTTQGNAYGYDRAFTVSPDEETIARVHRLAALRSDVGDRITVLDPFAGGGSIPFEAARYGCNSIANELNPVATAVLEGTVVQPAVLGPSSRKSLPTGVASGATVCGGVSSHSFPFSAQMSGQHSSGHTPYLVRPPAGPRPSPRTSGSPGARPAARSRWRLRSIVPPAPTR